MQKYALALSVIVFMFFISSCGGGSSSTVGTTIYDTPANREPVGPQMGGAIQGSTALALSKTVSLFAGTADSAGPAPGARLTAARFNQPVGIATDGTDYYVADYKNNMIRRINMADGTVENLAGNGLAGYSNGTGTAATFNGPTALTVSGEYLYVADTGNNMIRRVHKTSRVVTLLAGSSTGIAGAVDSKLVPTDARFSHPSGITTDGGNLYVADSNNHTIRRIVIPDPNDQTVIAAVTTLAGSPGIAGSTDGAQSVARFNQPQRITTDGSFLYVTDFLNRTIRRIDILSGSVTKIAGVSGPLDADGNIADGSGVTARFYQPNGITCDGVNLYVTDSYNNSIRMIQNPTEASSVVRVTTLIHGSGATPGATDGADGVARLDTPIGITTNGSALFVTDSRNHTIRMIE